MFTSTYGSYLLCMKASAEMCVRCVCVCVQMLLCAKQKGGSIIKITNCQISFDNLKLMESLIPILWELQRSNDVCVIIDITHRS